MLAVYIISAVLVLLVTLFLIPIHGILTISYSDGFEGIQLFGKFLFIRIPLYPSRKKEEEREEEKKEDKKEDSKKKSKPVTRLYKIVKEIDDDIYRIAKMLVTKTATLKRLALEARIGTDDAMQTGLAVGGANGFVYSLLGVMDNTGRLKEFSVSIEPDWSREIVDVGLYADISTNMFHLLRLFGALISLYFSVRKIMKRL